MTEIENCTYKGDDGERCTLPRYHHTPCTYTWAKSYADMLRRTGKMHSTEVGGWTVHHNGGFDGDAIFTRPKKGGEPSVNVEIPMSVVLTLAARAVASEKISKLEQQDPHEVLGLPKHLFK